MTTIIALASKYALVMGADSLGTVTKPMVDARELIRYFDSDNDFVLKAEGDVLSHYGQIWDEVEDVPYNQLPNMTKLFQIGKLPVGAMFTGISSIGGRPVRSLLAQFADEHICERNSSSLDALSDDLLEFLHEHYQRAHPDDSFHRPALELIVGGYDDPPEFPAIHGLDVRENEKAERFGQGEFGVAFDGTMDWVQRIVFGTDPKNKIRLAERTQGLMGQYRKQLLTASGLSDLPGPSELDLFDGWRLEEMDADWEEFSEQNAIDCVDFFLRIMIESQSVSSRLPTVGGDVHIAVIREDGYYPVTKEVWTHGDHEVPIPEAKQ